MSLSRSREAPKYCVGRKLSHRHSSFFFFFFSLIYLICGVVLAQHSLVYYGTRKGEGSSVPTTRLGTSRLAAADARPAVPRRPPQSPLRLLRNEAAAVPFCAGGSRGRGRASVPVAGAKALAKAARGWQELCAVRSGAERSGGHGLPRSWGRNALRGTTSSFRPQAFFYSTPRSGASAHKRAGNALRPLFPGDGAWAAGDVRRLGASWVVPAVKHRTRSQGYGGPRVGPRQRRGRRTAGSPDEAHRQLPQSCSCCSRRWRSPRATAASD